MKYYFSEFAIDGYNAGNKARTDAEEIFKKNGYSSFISRKLLPKASESLVYKILRVFDFISGAIKLRACRGITVIVQYPFKVTPRMKNSYDCFVNNNRIIYLVHDIETLRYGESEDKIKEEIGELNKADCIIVHNEYMKNRLIKMGITCRMICLGLFDYLFDGSIIEHSCLQKKVVFAGNIDKSVFVEEWIKADRNYLIALYGPNSRNFDNIDNCKYCGKFPPNEVPSKLDGEFGLVWDGVSAKGCDGCLGDYLRINNPHKLSMYIAAGLPVIVWKHAAMATFVEEHAIGVCVENLFEIQKILEGINDSTYEEMRKNIMEVRKSVVKGEYLANALNKL